MSSFEYRPASAPWLVQFSETAPSLELNGSRSWNPPVLSVPPAKAAVTLPAGTPPLG